MDAWARRWHLLTALVAAGAVVFQLVLVVQGSGVLVDTDPPSLAERLGQFFWYFTIQANLLVAVATFPLARDAAYDGQGWRVLRTASVVGITITGVVHFVLLRPLLDLAGADLVADTLLHMVVPALAFVGWLAFGPRPRTGPREIGLALIWPVVWLGLTFVILAASGWVPYPFLDAREDGGWPAVAVACVGVTVLFLVVSAAAYAVDRCTRRAPQPTGGPA